ncbi:general stress protein [Dactylosporangium sp. NPDC049525]|uniref:general stress protein n=1 Tax=Dactylosporangium sp. NPDC049525 TaxID=3154730 RepID=UPI003443B9FC
MRNTSNSGPATARDQSRMPFTAGVRPGAPDSRAQGWDRPPEADRFPEPGRDGAPRERAVVTVATYPDYASAQRAVDHLSDRKFPVDRVTIVGTDVRLVERVLGRMTTAKAALAGAGTGAWFGLLLGFLFGIFAVAAWWKVIVFAVIAGALWGAVFGSIAHASTRGRRDFTSVGAIEAANYAVLVDTTHADQARQLLGELTEPTAS